MSETKVDNSPNCETHEEDIEKEPDVYYKPVVELKPVKIVTYEEDEEEIHRRRCKLYRYAYDADEAEWRERGIGDIKILRHKNNHKIRIVMRREKVLTVCLNHYLNTGMQLSKAAGSSGNRAVIWSTMQDFADGDAKPEIFAARFVSQDEADNFRDKWNELLESLASSKENLSKKLSEVKQEDNDKKPVDELSDSVDKLSVKETKCADK